MEKTIMTKEIFSFQEIIIEYFLFFQK